MQVYIEREKTRRKKNMAETLLSKEENGYGAMDDCNTKLNGFNKLTYQHVYYDVPTINLCGLKLKRKRILTDCSGIMSQGLNAIMGPTGSGKTTLMDILAARKNRSYVRGQVLVNDAPQPYYFKCITGYVTQDDCLEGTLSVKENIFFSANLRLPSHINLKERRERVQDVIDKLGLTGVENNKIGTEFIRGVSGGERKRTNIAMELVIAPSIIFLDEPTTGLDAYTAVLLMRLLKELSNEGKIIITAIHQPRFAIFNTFDSLTLLSRGHTIYHGDAKKAVEYLHDNGHVCPERENPADFFLDVIAQDELNILACKGNRQIETMADQYHKSLIKRELNQQLDRMVENVAHNRNRNKMFFWESTYASNFFWQILVVGHRTLKHMIRSPLEFILSIIISVVFSTIIGGIYFKLTLTQEGLQNRIGGIFLIVMNQIFSNLSAIDAFMKGKARFIHENASGYYRVSAYFFAILLLDLIPKRIIPLLAGGTIMYFMMGFQEDVSKIFIFLLTLFVTTISAAGFPLLYGALVNDFAVANLLTALTFVIMMVFGGLLVNITTLPSWLQWVQYLSIFRLSISTLSINELEQLVFNQTVSVDGSCGTTQSNTGFAVRVPGKCYLEQQGILYGETFDVWRGVIGLAGFAFGLLVLTYLVLLLMKKEK